MLCQKCGNALQEGATFCPACGTQMQVIPNQAQNAAQTPGTPQAQGGAPAPAAHAAAAVPPQTAAATTGQPVQGSGASGQPVQGQPSAATRPTVVAAASVPTQQPGAGQPRPTVAASAAKRKPQGFAALLASGIALCAISLYLLITLFVNLSNLMSLVAKTSLSIAWDSYAWSIFWLVVLLVAGVLTIVFSRKQKMALPLIIIGGAAGVVAVIRMIQVFMNLGSYLSRSSSSLRPDILAQSYVVPLILYFIALAAAVIIILMAVKNFKAMKLAGGNAPGAPKAGTMAGTSTAYWGQPQTQPTPPAGVSAAPPAHAAPSQPQVHTAAPSETKGYWD